MNTGYGNERKSRFTLLWLLQLCLTCGIVCWLINPVSENIYVLAMMTITWLVIAGFRNYEALSIIFLKRWYVWAYLWILVLFLYSCVGHVDFSLSYIMYAFCFGIGAYYIVCEDTKAATIITCVSIGYLLIISVSTLQAYEFVPGLSRILANGDINVVIERGGGAFITPFIAGYGGIYGLAVLSVVLMFCGSKKCLPRILRLFLITISIFWIFVVIRAEYLVAVMLIIIGLGYLLISRIKSKRTKLIMSIISVLLLILIFGFGQYFFIWLADRINISNFSIRLRELASFFSGNGLSNVSDAGERLSMYTTSISSFLDAPLFGKGTGILFLTYGNHSTILDAFAKYGLIGGIAFIVFYYNPMKNILLQFGDNNQKGYKMFLTLILILALINVADTRVNFALVYIVCPLLLFSTERMER